MVNSFGGALIKTVIESHTIGHMHELKKWENTLQKVNDVLQKVRITL